MKATRSDISLYSLIFYCVNDILGKATANIACFRRHTLSDRSFCHKTNHSLELKRSRRSFVTAYFFLLSTQNRPPLDPQHQDVCPRATTSLPYSCRHHIPRQYQQEVLVQASAILLFHSAKLLGGECSNVAEALPRASSAATMVRRVG
jgi:hypothetical protein